MEFYKLIENIEVNCQQFYKINCTQDIFKAVGDLIRLSQELEHEYKRLAEKLGVKTKGLNTKSLNIINKLLYGERRIDKQSFENLKKVIKVRNYINHSYFLNDFAKDNIEQEKILNFSCFILCEGSDIISNLIDKKDGVSIIRPTVFDNYN